MELPDFVSKALKSDQRIIRITDNIYELTHETNELKSVSHDKLGSLILISGLSGAGKDSLLDEIVDKLTNVRRVKTCTTRPMRHGESEQNDQYKRLSVPQFMERVKSGDVLEQVEYAGNFYCTSWSSIEEVLKDNLTPIIRVDPAGARSILAKWKAGENIFKTINLFYFFVVPDSLDEMKQRLEGRGDDKVTVERRMAQSESDLAYITDAWYVVINRRNELNKTADEMIRVFNK